MNLQETKCTNKYRNQAFSHVGPNLWNLLPKDIRNEHDTAIFKKMLKLFLMTRGHDFNSWINRH